MPAIRAKKKMSTPTAIGSPIPESSLAIIRENRITPTIRYNTALM
jgi:hypothetical protein